VLEIEIPDLEADLRFMFLKKWEKSVFKGNLLLNVVAGTYYN